MAYKKDVFGYGYLDSKLRIECRNVVNPRGREEIISLLDDMAESGVDAWKYSVSAKGSFPLFPSKILPYRDTAEDCDYFRWVVDEAHQRGITILSWEYLNTAPLLAEKHPEYRVKFLGHDDIREERDDHFVCLLSPYGEMLKEFCVEVVKDLNFDGIWFDGSCQFGWGGAFSNRWFCCCDRCRQAFKDDTGLVIPTEINWQDTDFKEFLVWRSDMFMRYMAELAEYVNAREPQAVIVYNNFYGWYRGLMSGWALKHYPMKAVIACEDWPLMSQFRLKANRAISNEYPPESYGKIVSGARKLPPPGFEPDPTTNVYFARAAATVGGWSTIGANPSFGKHMLSVLSESMENVTDYVGGDPVITCGLVYSGYTFDFGNLEELEKRCRNQVDGDEKNKILSGEGMAGNLVCQCGQAMNNVHGMSFLLDHLNQPHELILDNQLLKEKTLSQYPVIIFPDVRCMEDGAEKVIRKYVEKGGTLLVTGQSGIKDSFGNLREKGLLDDILGITRRESTPRYCDLELVSQELSSDFPVSKFMISGMSTPVEVAEDVIVHALAREYKLKKPRWQETSSSQAHVVDGAAVCQRDLGKGKAIFIANDIGDGYAQNSSRRTRRIVESLLKHIERPFETDAPVNVQVTLWRQGRNLVLHLLNKPSSMYRMVELDLLYCPENFTTTAPITVSLEGDAKGARCPTSPESLHFEKNGKFLSITLKSLDIHDVIVIEDYKGKLEQNKK